MRVAEIPVTSFIPILWLPVCVTIGSNYAAPHFHGIDVEGEAI